MKLSWTIILLTILFCHSARGQHRLELVSQSGLPGFPSSSSVETYGGRIFVAGDDANQLVVLDSNYNRIDSVRLFESVSDRIAKPLKADIEAGTFVGTPPELVLFGSGSTPHRRKLYRVKLVAEDEDAQGVTPIDYSSFLNGVSDVLRNVNIEGAAIVGNSLLLGNRNAGSNVIIVAPVEDVLSGTGVSPEFLQLTLPDSLSHAGISGMTYHSPNGILFLTLSSEAAPTSYDDGPIGPSYLLWINRFDEVRLLEGSVAPSGIVALATSSSAFLGHKVEGVCVQSVSDGIATVHLVSDNDDGKSHVFKVRLSLRD